MPNIVMPDTLFNAHLANKIVRQKSVKITTKNARVTARVMPAEYKVNGIFMPEKVRWRICAKAHYSCDKKKHLWKPHPAWLAEHQNKMKLN